MSDPPQPAQAPPSIVTPRSGPLAGVRVLDLTAVVLGPMATQILGDFGADVIKLEAPEGDLMRANGVARTRGMSAIFMAINRNKRSLALDLKRPEGLAAALRLLPNVDVLVHNMRPAAIERLGLGYASCAAINPRLIYAVATGFGEGGPDAGQPAFDDVIQAACGLAELMGRDSGQPAYVPSLIADKTTGLMLANAVLAALYERTRSGCGQHVEVPMFESMVAFMMAEHLGGLSFEPPLGGAGYARLLAGGRKPAPTRDGFVALLPYTAAHWQRFFAHVGRADLSQKHAVDDRHARSAGVQALYADLVAITATLTTAELLALCRTHDIPATRLHRLDDLPHHPHAQAVGLFQRTEHPSQGTVLQVRPTTRFARTPAELALPAPRLGEHSEAVLMEAGLSVAECAALRATGVVITPKDAPGA